MSRPAFSTPAGVGCGPSWHSSLLDWTDWLDWSSPSSPRPPTPPAGELRAPSWPLPLPRRLSEVCVPPLGGEGEQQPPVGRPADACALFAAGLAGKLPSSCSPRRRRWLRLGERLLATRVQGASTWLPRLGCEGGEAGGSSLGSVVNVSLGCSMEPGIRASSPGDIVTPSRRASRAAARRSLAVRVPCCDSLGASPCCHRSTAPCRRWLPWLMLCAAVMAPAAASSGPCARCAVARTTARLSVGVTRGSDGSSDTIAVSSMLPCSTSWPSAGGICEAAACD